MFIPGVITAILLSVMMVLKAVKFQKLLKYYVEL